MPTPSQEELEKQAREQLFKENIERDKSILSNWFSESDRIWKEEKKFNPFVSIPVYPTKEQLSERITLLSKQIEESEALKAKAEIIDVEPRMIP